MVLPATGALSGAAAPFAYEGGLLHAVHTIKEYRDQPTIHFFADAMHRLILQQWDGTFDLVVPVAASRRTMRTRGFNQAAELAAELARLLRSPCAPRVLARRSRARAQHELTASERRKNAAESYFLRESAGLRGKRILLVDDVFTTGATLASCATLLRHAGAQIYGITATYTPAQRNTGYTPPIEV